MDKLDLRSTLKSFYAPSARKVDLVEVPEFGFAMVDGAIEENKQPGSSPAFQDALQALYGISYTLKFGSKLRKEKPIDYTVMPLEALWWVEGEDFDITRPAGWQWTAMILQPDHITAEMFAEAKNKLAKKRGESSTMDLLRLERFHEGLCVQTMHIGPYSSEPATIEKMGQFAQENGYRRRGRHHEIYLGDPRRVEPAKLKTVLRQPVEPF